MQLTINIKDPEQEPFVLNWLMQHEFIEFSMPQFTNLSFYRPNKMPN